MSARSVFKNFSNLRGDGKKKKGKKKKPPPPRPPPPPPYNPIHTRKKTLILTPEQVRSRLLHEIILVMADAFCVNSIEPDLRHLFGMDRTVEIIRNNRKNGVDLDDGYHRFFQNPSADELQLRDALIMIIRKYIPDDTVIDLANLKFENLMKSSQLVEVVRSILRNQQGNWLPQSVSRPMNEEIQAVAKKYSKQFQKKLLIEAFKKGKSQDGKWSMRRESAIRTLQNSEPIIELRKRVYAPGGSGQEVARLSYAAAQGAAAQENPSSSSQGETKVSTSRCVGDNDCWRGEESKEMCLSYNMDPETKKSRCSWKGGRRRKKTRRKKKRKRKSHRRRKSKKRKTKSRKN